ncbi:ATP-binding protein [Methyloversatilis sp. XJ19-13]|uniref:sensor histidine kinase n=1 Tax=Methyloversatilis sp. XJ19-13 TaxID=2963430 RepID=UPI00211BBA76|nr:ATP-binding protein [Methyloversatilis sp. XJ19-13]MCQ9372647.1 ATP-binding protein [Methyloversatilis sp. XJ19-13]
MSMSISISPAPDALAADALAAADFERKLRARDKTIEVLKKRIQQQADGSTTSSFALLEQNLSLGKVIALKTEEVERERQELQKALTDLRQAQSQLLQAQKMESIGQLAAGIAHEINTPTQYVADNIGFIDLASSSLMTLLDKTLKVVEAARASQPTDGLVAEVDAAVKKTKLDYLRRQIPEALAQSKEGLEHVARIVSAMKEFSHPSNGGKELLDIRDVINTTVTVARSEWKYVAELETRYADDLPQVSCMRDMIGQVILNLVVNAAHAVADTLQSGVREKGKIRIMVKRAGEQHIAISVADDGGGIPEGIRGRIFDPFFTTKPVGKGTGQGLAIVYSTVVDKHGGEIRCDSEVGRGTCFTIRLPLSADNGEAPCK